MRLNCNSILLHGGLNPAWHFWLSTRVSFCLKMKSVENILCYIQGQFYRFSRVFKPWENLWNCSRKYPIMFKTDFIFREQKIEFKPMSDVVCYATGCFVTFSRDLLYWNRAKTLRNCSVVQLYLELLCCLPSLFCCLPPLFHCLPLWKTVKLYGKKAPKCNKNGIR